MNFGQYLRQLRNEKSLSQRDLAVESGISNAEISRIETGERQKPSPDVLRALSPVIGVSYESLMGRAGYLDSQTMPMEDSEIEEKFIEIITPKLIKDGWSVKLCKGLAVGDILAKKDDKEWYIDLKYFRSREDIDNNFRDDLIVRNDIYNTFGRLAVYDGPELWKFTIALNSKKAFDNLTNNFSPRLLNVSVSVMLVDFKNHRIVTEQQLTKC
jgi:transcriptional regulator with XRE-family HTH domain